MEKAIKCEACAEVPPLAHFAAASRPIYTCRKCTSRKESQRRRTDPAVRLADRVRMRAKRSGFAMNLSVADIRTLLESVRPEYVKADLVKLDRVRQDAPLAANNVALRQAAVLRCSESTAPLSSGGTIPFALV